MTIRAREAVAAKFLRDALTSEAVPVRKLDGMARVAGLLSEKQSITNAKRFRRAKDALGVRSVRHGFGADGGWAWELPAPPIEPERTHVERLVPREWIEGVARLQYHRPPPDVPRHQWAQFVRDCDAFLKSEQLASRAAELGWTAMALFGCCPKHPLSYLGSAGLLWHLNGGRIIELHRDWAIIDRPVNRSHHIFLPP